MDWMRILLTVVAVYLIFLVFTKFTKWIFKLAIIVLLIGVIIYGNINYSDMADYMPFSGEPEPAEEINLTIPGEQNQTMNQSVPINVSETNNSLTIERV